MRMSHLVIYKLTTMLSLRRHSNSLSCSTEYATVGYMAKRIQMRKNRFLAIQKIAEQKKAGLDAAHAPPPGPPGEGDHAPKQTVSVASQNCSTIPRGHDAPHAQPHGVTTPPTQPQHHRGMLTGTGSVVQSGHLPNTAYTGSFLDEAAKRRNCALEVGLSWWEENRILPLE
jgi:hypothetical protein